MRRDRLERIAIAERDRRAGRVELAVAAIGEPSEWPARAVLALASLSGPDTDAARRLLEEGLDLWAGEMGLGALDPIDPVPAAREREGATNDALKSHLDQPFDSFELDRAFAEAQTQTEDMRNVNQVAERILMDEPVGLAEMSDEPLTPIEGIESDSGIDGSVEEEMDAAFVAGEAALSTPAFDEVPPPSMISPAAVSDPIGTGADSRRPPRAVVLATLERWLGNLERQREGRVR